ncbi:hypothetical protein ABPG77_002660 [Micractinium sp. CCAP 211/92]
MQNNPELPAVAAQLSSQAREHVQTHKKRQDAPGHERDSNDQDARADGEAAAAKRQRRSPGGNEWLRAWAWKREHRPDKQVAGEVRFDRPYLHPMRLPSGEEVKLTVHQARFKATGFASTVWDSSIVLAKYFEKHPRRCAGRRCLDLSAGCGLPGLVLARLGAASVTATDLGPNLALLRKNSDANGCGLRVEEHSWGTPVGDGLEPPYDVVVACDVMYIAEAVAPLVASLVALSGPATEVYISHGRNRQAEPQFLEAAGKHFAIETVGSDELDEVYQTADVDVLRLRRLGAARASEAAGGLVVPLPPAPRPVQPLPKATLPQPGSLMLPQRGPTALQASAARPGPCPSRARLPLAPANRQSILPPSPGWPSCSPQHARAPSDDASSPRGQGLHVLAADVREAVSGGLSGRVSKSLESLLFISSGTSINAALATRNRKTDLDIEEPSPPVAALVRAFEALRSQLAASGGEARAELMQEVWGTVTARMLKRKLGAARRVQLKQRMAARFAGRHLQSAREAAYACAEQAEAAMASCGAAGSDAAALAALEAMQRFALRTLLPVAPDSGLHAFSWLDASVAALCPALRGSGSGPATPGSPGLQAALAVLADVHEAVEDAAGGLPEAQRYTLCRRMLTAVGAAALARCLRADAGPALPALPCLDALDRSAALLVQSLAERALASAARLADAPRPLSAATELLERGARLMRLGPSGWAAAMWPLLRALQLEV